MIVAFLPCKPNHNKSEKQMRKLSNFISILALFHIPFDADENTSASDSKNK